MPRLIRQTGGHPTTSNARKLDIKGRTLSKGATKPTYKGPKTSRGVQKRALTRNH
jgi:hypothetical protein